MHSNRRSGAANGASAVNTYPLATIPALSSRPSASAKIFLDFDGDAALHNTPAYDQDGDPASFTTDELTNIELIWARVAEKFSPFNVDVTTVDPGNRTIRQTLHVLIGGFGDWTGEVLGGKTALGVFYGTSDTDRVAYVFEDNLGNGHPLYVGESAAHEAAHAFGVDHQSLYDGSGTLVQEHFEGDAARAPIMGASYYSERGVWWNGTAGSASTIQDDLALLADLFTNGFGYRPDDHGGTPAGASALRSSGGAVYGAGVIENTADADYFSFTTPGGPAAFAIRPSAFAGMLDASLELRDGSGNLVASAATSSLGETLTSTLSAGTYYLVVRSQGNYGDIGQYALSGTLNGSAIDSAPPTRGVSAGNIAVEGGQEYTFTVSYLDDAAVDVTTLDGSDITVVGPAGVMAASLVSVDDPTNGASRTATYRITPPGGAWDGTDNGTYAVQVRLGQVLDTSGNAVAGGVAGAFNVRVPLGQFGLVDGRRVKLAVPGTRVVMSMKGAGTGTAYPLGGLVYIDLVGTDATSVAKIARTGLELGDINAAGGAKAIVAPGVALRGAVTGGAIGKLTLGTLTGGTVTVPALGQVLVRGQVSDAAIVVGAGSGTLGKLFVKGPVSRSAIAAGSLAKTDVGGLVESTLAAASLGPVKVRGEVRQTMVLAGANFGSDGVRGGTGPAADTYGMGSLAKFNVRGAMSDSTVAAGIDLSNATHTGKTAPLSHDGLINWIRGRDDATGSSIFASRQFGGEIVLGRLRIKLPSDDPRLRTA